MIPARNILLLLNLTLWFQPGIAQVLTDTLHIKEVSIYKKESPANQVLHETLIDTLAIQQSIHLDLSELLSRHSTVYIKSTGDGLLSTASFRGTDPGHTKVFWNGIRLNSPMLGQVDLSMVPVCFADQVKLLHGSSSLTESSGALGGIISLQGIPDWDSKTGLKINQEAGSFHSYHTTSELDLRFGNLLSSSKFFFNQSQNDFTFTNTGILPVEETRLKKAGFHKSGFNQDAYYRLNHKNQVSLHLWYQQADRNIPQPMSYEGDERSEMQFDKQLFSIITWKHYRDKSTMEVRSGMSLARINYLFEFPELRFVNVDSRSKEEGVHNQFKLNREINNKLKLTTTVSHMFHQVSIYEKVRSEGYNAHQSELSVMMMFNREMSDRLSAWILMREDLVNTTFLPVMPSLGLSYKILKNNELYLKSNLSRNYNVPSLNDLYWIPGGNPGLKPEMSYTGDLSGSMSHKKGNHEIGGEITGFVSWIEDWILWKPTQFHYWTAENIASVFSRGLEAMFNSAVAGKNYKIQLNANYSLTFTTNQHTVSMVDQSRGKQLVYIPRHVMNTHAYFDFKGYYLNYSLILTGKRYTQSSNEESHFETVLNPYALNHVLFGKEIILSRMKTTIQFGIYNIFNKSYQVILARPMPGRYYSINLGVSL